MHTVEHVGPLELELWNRPDFNMFEEHVQTPQFGEPIPRRPVHSTSTMEASRTVIQLIELFEGRIKSRRVPRSMIHASLRLDDTEFKKPKSFTSDN
jgi:hypothetical protein